MIPITKLSGRLGNQMFQYAFLLAVSEDQGVDTYFQDPVWFQKVNEKVRILFSADIPPMTDMVSIHVRRGDYIKNSMYVDLSETDYYDRAMKLFPNDIFLVFSDDIAWCKEHFGLYNPKVRYCELIDEVAAMNLMASCKHNIVANSTFSWWAAWLNKNKDKKVIAPKSWFTDGIERTICPVEWKKI